MTNTAPAGGQEPTRRRIGADLPLRVISSLVLAPLAIGAAYYGGWPFLLFWLVAAIAVLWEWNGLVADRQGRIVTIAGWAGVVAGALALGVGRPVLGLLIAVAAAGFVAVLVSPERRGWVVVGVPYAAAVVFSPVLLRVDEANGFAAIMLLFAVVWGTDVAAYFGGRLIGGPKLWSRVSPKKTWSGALVGSVFAILGGVIVAKLAGVGNLAAVAGLSFLLSAASQAGDFFESGIKRRFGVKDASQLIPGHGGLMDRLDGFVVAAALAALIGVARGGFEAPSHGLLIW